MTVACDTWLLSPTITPLIVKTKSFPSAEIEGVVFKVKLDKLHLKRYDISENRDYDNDKKYQ